MTSVSVPSARWAIVLFIPPPVAYEIDEIRRRWDPVMTARIDAHITLIHDVVERDNARRLVASAAAGTEPFAVTLTTTACWGRASNGVYVRVDDTGGVVAELHRCLAPLEAPAWSSVPYRPHVTLVHGRTVAPELAEPAWSALCDRDVNWRVELGAIDIIELDDPSGWRTVGRLPLATAAITD